MGSVDISLSSEPIISILPFTVKFIQLSKMANYFLLLKDIDACLFHFWALVDVAYRATLPRIRRVAISKDSNKAGQIMCVCIRV